MIADFLSVQTGQYDSLLSEQVIGIMTHLVSRWLMKDSLIEQAV